MCSTLSCIIQSPEDVLYEKETDRVDLQAYLHSVTSANRPKTNLAQVVDAAIRKCWPAMMGDGSKYSLFPVFLASSVECFSSVSHVCACLLRMDLFLWSLLCLLCSPLLFALLVYSLRHT